MIFTSSLKKGLSLMEVMIVLAIMAVFALAVGPAMMGYLTKAKVKTTEANLQVVKQAITSYHTDTGQYPETLSDLIRKPLDEAIAKKWYGPYLNSKDEDYIPVDGWNNDLVYHRSESGSNQPYELYSYGSGGEDAPEEDRIYG